MIPAEVIKGAGLSYDWYIEEAKSIVRELEQGKEKEISQRYLEEKLHNVLNLFKDLAEEEQRQKSIKKLQDYENKKSE